MIAGEASGKRARPAPKQGVCRNKPEPPVTPNRDGVFDFSYGKSTVEYLLIGTSAYYLANASYLQNFTNYSTTVQAQWANTWIKYGSVDAADLIQQFSIGALAKSISHLTGKLTILPNRRIDDVPVIGVHSSTSGDLYVSRSKRAYPVETLLVTRQSHKLFRFSGWNNESLPTPPSEFLIADGNTSPTWSGYVLLAAPGTLSEASASWIEPTADSASTPNSWSAAWVGIDGQLNGRVFQLGTRTNCSAGAEIDNAWFENYPAAPKIITTNVRPGDAITVEVDEVSPGMWAYSFEDHTTNQTVTSLKPIRYKGPGSSAEWIEEDPGNAAEPLTNFGSIAFSGVGVNRAPANLDRSDSGLDMWQNGQLVSQVSQFATDGFSVMYR